MSDYRVTVKVQNNNILKRINESGFKSVSEFGKTYNINYGHLGQIINMKASVFTKEGNFRSVVKKTAEALSCLPEDLFTEKQLSAEIKTNVKTYEVSEQDIRFMLESQIPNQEPERLVFEEKLKDKTHEVLGRLTPREAKVIKLRFGFGGPERTFEEIAREMDVTRERIRQIEVKALRKLRHPSRSSELRDFIGE